MTAIFRFASFSAKEIEFYIYDILLDVSAFIFETLFYIYDPNLEHWYASK